ncbi:MAG: hypothetical protein CVU02_02010 [Bacteroidetes bacterium HGW-Bacteroidetes-19]|nr:MAG: hypothetical protein CVU04_00510 [Bacteroidetes bacterium HGW-Bacteroidetes-20]PKP28119.1 MAG: hypothetical protein CVU02_02010 [Bacteroidetes bacterium HGW-Bacteroidetes-19]
MKKIPLILILVAIFATAVFTSCERDQNDDFRKNAARDDIRVDNMMDDIVAEADQFSDFITIDKNGSKDGSKTFTIVNNPDGSVTVTVTYVNYSNPNFANSHVKNGIINIHIIGAPSDSTFIKFITFNNFTIDNNLITGSITITKTAPFTHTILLTNCMISFTDGTTYTRSGQKTRTQIEGMNTPYLIWDNTYEIVGTFTGTNRNNIAYVHEVTTPLVRKMAYHYIVQGVLHLEIGNRDIVIDFGDGTLDNLVDITINGTTYYDVQLTH